MIAAKRCPVCMEEIVPHRCAPDAQPSELHRMGITASYDSQPAATLLNAVRAERDEARKELQEWAHWVLHVAGTASTVRAAKQLIEELPEAYIEACKLLDEISEALLDRPFTHRSIASHRLDDLEALLRERHASWPGWSK